METVVGTGLAETPDGRVAGRQAAATATDPLPTGRVDFCQVFVDADYDYEAVLAGVRDAIGPEASLLGCSAIDPFTEAGTSDGVAVAALASDTLEVFTGLGTGLSRNVSAAVREAVEALPPAVDDFPYAAAINLHDGLAGVGEELALETQQKLGPEVAIAGGSASDDHRMEATYVFCDRESDDGSTPEPRDEIVEDGVAIGVLAAERRPVVAVNHGHEPLSEPVEVTEAEGHRVHRLDGEPAFEVWKDAVRDTVRSEFDVEIDDLALDDQLLQRILCEFEFGIDQGDRFKMRWPWVEDDSGTLHFSVDVPEGTVLRVMHGRPDAQVASARETVRAALADAGDDPMAGAFVYDCACRGVVLGEGFDDAVAGMAAELDLPLAGFETYGEVCMGPGAFSGFHNTTTVVLLLPG